MINLARRLSKFQLQILALAFVLSLGLPAPRAFAQSGPGITSPATGSSVQGSVPLHGTASSDPFARCALYSNQEPSRDEP